MQRGTTRLPLGVVATLGIGLAGCTDLEAAPPPRAAPPAQPVVSENPRKDAYFGDLHVHSSWSLDAFAFQVRVGPEDAYRYARGEAIAHVSGEPIRMLGPPLDFIALTEHGNYMGIPSAAQEPGSPVSRIPLIRALLDPDPAVHGPAMGRVFEHLSRDALIPELDPDAVKDAGWSRLVGLANRNDEPGRFTAFVGYEYTSMPEGQNLHRNVIFRGSDVPTRPFSSFDSQNPEDLWRWMDEARERGSDVIAIPHNANGSNGLMYERTDRAGRPIDATYAATRLRNEPVSEVIQIKGQSETHPGLSPDDEWARFQILDTILGRPRDPSRLQGSYARRALMDGLELEEARGANPYRMGMIGASDGHNASSPVEEDNYTGKIGLLDGTPTARIPTPGAEAGQPGLDAGDLRSGSPFGAAGLAGVWAEANTRGHIFDALRAREVFATSGPRIVVRLFGGWDFAAADLANAAEAGYARGVPMGGELAAGPVGTSPTFLIEALKDPREAPLARMQIVKAWVEDGKARERVYDVACADESAPDPETHRCSLEASAPGPDCSYDPGEGSPALSAAWRDPHFDAGQRSLYYARILQIPTCRWSSWDALRLGVPRPPGAPEWIEERAITSPIWYAPGSQT